MPEPEKPQEVSPETNQGFRTILAEYDVELDQQRKRRDLLEKIELAEKGKKSGAIAFVSSDALDTEDIAAFADALLAVGDVEILNLIIESPGGNGTVAEKLIDLCRSYCKIFRVIIPQRAKSAATIMALGADEIIMGFCSELGPIDAQLVVRNNGVLQYISAQSFLDARDALMKQYEDFLQQKKDVKPILQQIAALDPPFLQHCEQLMAFGKDVVKQNLARYMFKGMKAQAKDKKIQDVIRQLSTVQEFRVHGRKIDGTQARTKLGLKIKQLGKMDPLWKAIYEYFLRANVLMTRHRITTVIETKSSLLTKRSST